MSAGSRGKRYPAGSTAQLRADVLAVLGVLKVATPEQITRYGEVLAEFSE